MSVRQATDTLFVFLTSSSYTALAAHVKYQLVEVCVTNQGTPREGRCTENHADRDLYRKMFITTLFIVAKN